MVETPWLSVQDAAKYLHMSESRMYQLVRSGEMESRKHGKNGVYIHTMWLDAWMLTQPTGAKQYSQLLQV